MTKNPESLSLRIELPIEELVPGTIAPPLEPSHESWAVLNGWDDPLAPRGGYRVPPGKTRVDHAQGPAIEWDAADDHERALVTGAPTWREYTVECRMQALQVQAGPTRDGWFIDRARAGLAFRIETSRRHYYFGLEGKSRLVLYRRIDDEWFELAAQDVEYDERIVTLRVELDGDGIQACCPELGVTLNATDATIPLGKAGFRALGACRLFDLRISQMPSQQVTNQRVEEARLAQIVHLSGSIPDARPVGEIKLPGGWQLLEAEPFADPARNDLLLDTTEGLLAATWEGRELWTVAERPSAAMVSAPAADGARRIYALVGERQAPQTISVTGRARRRVVAEELIAIDGTSGKILHRAELPPLPLPTRYAKEFDLSFETGCLSSSRPFDLVIRTNSGSGARHLWAYDENLDLIWQREVELLFGHNNAVHLIDLNADGRAEVLAGGVLLSADGEVLMTHDRGEEMTRIADAGHYDAVLAGNFGDDPESDPIALLISGSAGVYVIDPLSGRTRAVHRIGHAQGGTTCRVRDDIPGRQFLVGTRWGNMGITTLFSGRGERLWSIHPDHFWPFPIQWLKDGPEHIVLNSHRDSQGLYDGYGRKVRPLEKVRRLWGDSVGMADVPARILRREPGGRDLLAVHVGDRMVLFQGE